MLLQILGLVLAVVATIVAGLVPAGVIILAIDHRAREWTVRQARAVWAALTRERPAKPPVLRYVVRSPFDLVQLRLRIYAPALLTLRIRAGLILVGLGVRTIGCTHEIAIEDKPPAGAWSCTRCGDNEHQVKAKACGRSPCPMVPVSPLTGPLEWKPDPGWTRPPLEVASMYQGARPHRAGCLPDCPCMTRGKVTPNMVRAARLAAGREVDPT